MNTIDNTKETEVPLDKGESVDRNGRLSFHDNDERELEADGKVEKAESSNAEEDVTLTSQEEKRLLRRIDLAMVPYLSLLYLLSFLDRVNIGQANVAGLTQDLRLKGNQYQVALSVFFISYIVFETPALLLLRKMKPHRLIPLIMVLWGLNMTFMGFVTSAGGLQASRFTLGLAESALFPGLNFLLSTWYKRSELNLRTAIFFSGATLAGACVLEMLSNEGTSWGLHSGGRKGPAYIPYRSLETRMGFPPYRTMENNREQ